MKTVIKTQNLCKTFQVGGRPFEALRNINLEIREGEFVSIMGQSGSGKSTLLYLLGCLDSPTSGEIFIRDTALSTMTDIQASEYRRKRLGFVFQFYNLVPNLTVEENTLLPILLDGQKAKSYKQRLDEVISVVGLSDRKKHLPTQLSGGQQQRVAIARALIHNPDIILADEPTGNLDSKTGNEIMELFRQINAEQGKTIVQVTHSSEAAKRGDRVVTLLDGIIITI